MMRAAATVLRTCADGWSLRPTTPYRIVTACCGRVCLSRAQYERQLARAAAPWRCPEHGTRAEFDDAWYEGYCG